MFHCHRSETELMRVLREAQAERFLCECAFSMMMSTGIAMFLAVATG